MVYYSTDTLRLHRKRLIFKNIGVFDTRETKHQSDFSSTATCQFKFQHPVLEILFINLRWFIIQLILFAYTERDWSARTLVRLL